MGEWQARPGIHYHWAQLSRAGTPASGYPLACAHPRCQLFAIEKSVNEWASAEATTDEQAEFVRYQETCEVQLASLRKAADGEGPPPAAAEERAGQQLAQLIGAVFLAGDKELLDLAAQIRDVGEPYRRDYLTARAFALDSEPPPHVRAVIRRFFAAISARAEQG